jgi:RHS repeat-associated protein
MGSGQGQLHVSNSVAVTPEISGTNFWINSFVTGLGTQQVVAAIRDQAGNMGYATNEIFLSVVTNGAYQYNAAGCVTNIAYTGAEYAKSISLGWNAQYQLTNAGAASNLVQYRYDVLGRRESRTEGTNVEQYVYDGNQVIADLDGSGNILRSYTWGPGIDNLLAVTTYSATETNTCYALKDNLNTVHALINASGEIVERYEYDAWGRTTVYDAAGDELTESAIGNRYTFQGREIDWATGLIYFRARWYNPVVGRWLSNDIIGIAGGLNQYVAFNNSAVNFADPEGLKVTFNAQKAADFIETYRSENAYDWVANKLTGGNAGEVAGYAKTSAEVANSGVNAFMKYQRSGAGTFKGAPTSWQSSLSLGKGPRLPIRIFKTTSAVRALGRATVALTIFEGWYDLGIVLGGIGRGIEWDADNGLATDCGTQNK